MFSSTLDANRSSNMTKNSLKKEQPKPRKQTKPVNDKQEMPDLNKTSNLNVLPAEIVSAEPSLPLEQSVTVPTTEPSTSVDSPLAESQDTVNLLDDSQSTNKITLPEINNIDSNTNRPDIAPAARELWNILTNQTVATEVNVNLGTNRQCASVKWDTIIENLQRQVNSLPQLCENKYIPVIILKNDQGEYTFMHGKVLKRSSAWVPTLKIKKLNQPWWKKSTWIKIRIDSFITNIHKITAIVGIDQSNYVYCMGTTKNGEPGVFKYNIKDKKFKQLKSLSTIVGSLS